MKKIYLYQTTIGNFYICRAAHSYILIYEDELLDFYLTPEDAARACAEECQVTLPNRPETTPLGISDDLRRWRRVY